MDLQDLVDLCDLGECLRLINCSRNSVKDEPVRAVIFLQSFLQHRHNDGIGNKRTFVYKRFCMESKLCSFANCCAKHISRPIKPASMPVCGLSCPPLTR